MRLAFTLEYDGTSFSGFQSQKNVPTVQDVLRRPLKRLQIKIVGLIIRGELMLVFMLYLKYVTLKQQLKELTKNG